MTWTKDVESRPYAVRGHNQRSCVIQDQCADRRRYNTKEGPSRVPDEIRGFEGTSPSKWPQDTPPGIWLETAAPTGGDSTHLR